MLRNEGARAISVRHVLNPKKTLGGLFVGKKIVRKKFSSKKQIKAFCQDASIDTLTSKIHPLLAVLQQFRTFQKLFRPNVTHPQTHRRTHLQTDRQTHEAAFNLRYQSPIFCIYITRNTYMKAPKFHCIKQIWKMFPQMSPGSQTIT